MLLYRTILLMLGGGGLIIGIVLVFLLAMSWGGSQRLAPISAHADFYLELQATQTRLAEYFPPAPASAPAERTTAVRDAAATLERLAADGRALSPATAGELSRLGEGLESASGAATADAGGALRALRELLAREGEAHAVLLDDLARHLHRQLQAALALALVLPIFGVAFLSFAHRRILIPLKDLGYMLGQLARKDYSEISTEAVDPLMRPLFDKYNRVVKRMHDLEQGHVKREDSLRDEVDQAARALFQQQAAMARTERLAAVGEVAARLSHELRNPLSGVLMALTNLRTEIDADDQDERLGLAIAELERMAHLLSGIVAESRQHPEQPGRLHLRPAVEGLARLMKYQLESHIDLVTDVPEDLYCHVAESGLRSALMNLVLNAAQVLGERAGTISITAGPVPGAVAVAVSDDGPGYPEALLDAGVREFASWRQGGTGLGLATVRRFVAANGGRLQLSNRPEGGARATLLLPPDASPDGPSR